jgi:pyruvate-formate lyase
VTIRRRRLRRAGHSHLGLEALRRAQQNPAEYRDLVVRIGGYTDYFVRLSPEMQDEVIMRTEFARL